jgi:hypothetical protein
MKAPELLLTALISCLVLAPAAHAANDDEEMDDLDSESKSTSSKTPKARKPQEVREIVKGTYAKANVGGALYLGSFSGLVNPGTSVGLTLGRDFLNQENKSAAGEIMFFQGIHNGKHYEEQVALGACPPTCIQGDLRTYTVAAVGEFSFYPKRRIGVGIRAGGGVMLSPLLMDEKYYNEEVVQTWGYNPTVHSTPHPMGIGGPTFEYYTKLSHFSVGFDADIFYSVGVDLGTSLTGNLKYTF